MKNEDKAKEIAINNHVIYSENDIDVGFSHLSSEDECYESAMEMAKWKDEQHKEREEALQETISALDASLQKANEAGMHYFDQCNLQKQQLIDKACKWLKNNMYEGTCEQILSKKPYPFMQDFINEFKKAMKG